jgi:hypothetical protein
MEVSEWQKIKLLNWQQPNRYCKRNLYDIWAHLQMIHNLYTLDDCQFVDLITGVLLLYQLR